jgi:hypothetical protein
MKMQAPSNGDGKEPFSLNYFNVGSTPVVFGNIYGIKIDLSWFNIVSSIFSVIAILLGSRWIVKPIQKETNGFVAVLVFIPLFFYRMVAWLIIITLLHTFSLAVFAGFVFINILIFMFLQDPLEVEPLAHSFLSIIFPVTLLPTSNFKTNNSLKLLFWLVLIGNLTLFGVLAILCVLYHYDLYNPWCCEVSTKLLLPESAMNNMHYLIMSILLFATLPVIVCFSIAGMR